MNKLASDGDNVYKIVLIGNASVGKTCILNRLVNKVFSEDSQPTVGTMFMEYTVEMDKVTYQMNIWDTAGQERLRAIVPLYYRDADGVMLVYDITRQESLEGLKSWFDDLKTHGQANVCKVIIGNKMDLISQQEVSHSDAQDMADQYNSSLVLASAKSGEGVEAAFKEMLKVIIKRNTTQNTVGHATHISKRGSKTLDNSIADSATKPKSKCC